MKAVKILGIALGLYVAIVVAFESSIGYFQPTSGNTLAITTTDASGKSHGRMVTRLVAGGQLYVAANHWPRAWYRQALANPDVEVDFAGEHRAYRAVPVTGSEHELVERANGVSVVFRLLTGFPPRYFLRLDPR